MDQSCLCESQDVPSLAEEQPSPFKFCMSETSNTRETKAQDISYAVSILIALCVPMLSFTIYEHTCIKRQPASQGTGSSTQFPTADGEGAFQFIAGKKLSTYSHAHRQKHWTSSYMNTLKPRHKCNKNTLI